MRSPAPIAALPRRDFFLISGCIILVTALAWAYLVHLDHRMGASAAYEVEMAQMGMTIDTPWHASDVLFAAVMWAVMMVGMMSMSVAPLLLLFAGMQSRRGGGDARLQVLSLGLGYITVWVAFSVFAALAQWALHEGALLSPMLATTSPRVGGAFLIAAGVYQLTPLKGMCLRQCQSPLGFLMGNWRDGAGGAFQIGLRHGVYCLGCCWALMCVLFAAGIMNLAWVAALSVFILLEKTGRIGSYLGRTGGIALIASGIFLVAR